MPTALEQQAQFQQILRDSLAPIFENTLFSQRSQNLADELRSRAEIAGAGRENAIKLANIAAASHLADIQEQAKAITGRLDAKDKELQLRKLRATIPQKPKEDDEAYFERATGALPGILDNADANIAALNAKTLDLSRRNEAANLSRARTAAANAIRPFLSPEGANQIVGLLSKGVSPEQVIGQAQRDIGWKFWQDKNIPPAQQQAILGQFQQAYDVALAKPQFSESIQAEYRNTEEELKKALASRELLRSSFPEAALGQAAKGVTTLPKLDLGALTGTAAPGTAGPMAAGGADQFLSTNSPPASRVTPRSMTQTPAELQSSTYTRGLIPTLASAVAPVRDYASAAASLIPVTGHNLGAMLFGGNYVPPFSSPQIDQLKSPDPNALAQFGRMIQAGLVSQVNPALLPTMSPAAASQFGQFFNAIRNPIAAQQIPADITTVPNPAPSPDEEALMRELAPFLYPNQ